MTFRGYFALDGAELANSSRVTTHLGRDLPTSDLGMFHATYPDGSTYPGEDLEPGEPDTRCALTEVSPGLWEAPPESVEVYPKLWTPPNGARRHSQGLSEITGECWGPITTCRGCVAPEVLYDDSWPGLREFLTQSEYRPELAPWYTTQQPESGEFAGVWVMQVEGLGPTPVDQPVSAAIGPGTVAGPRRDAGRTLNFEALLIGCTNAGVEYGLEWLACRLRAASPQSVLRYMQAHPGHSAVDPETLIREVHGVVLTQEPKVTAQTSAGRRRNQQAVLYRVQWSMATLSPYAYLPPEEFFVDWDEISRQPVNWIHASECTKPETCIDMPILFSATCVPEEIDLVNTPPPVCGGCMPVSGIDKYSYRVPTMTYPATCRETAVSMTITNTGEMDLTLQAFWRECGDDIRCEDDFWPLQVNALPPGASLTLDGVRATYWAYYNERVRMPRGIVQTPKGAPWRPPVIDRQTCWDFIVQTASTSEFDITLSLADRAA